MERIFYFAYGSNMNQEDLDRYCQKNGNNKIPLNERNPRKAVLKDYELVFNYYSSTRGGGAANIEPKTGSSVEGVVFDLTEDEFEIIRKKEGAPNYYKEKIVSVYIEGSPVQVYTFQVTEGKKEDVIQFPTQKYINIIIEGAKEFSLSDAWIKKLKKIPVKSS